MYQTSKEDMAIASKSKKAYCIKVKCSNGSPQEPQEEKTSIDKSNVIYHDILCTIMIWMVDPCNNYYDNCVWSHEKSNHGKSCIWWIIPTADWSGHQPNYLPVFAENNINMR